MWRVTTRLTGVMLTLWGAVLFVMVRPVFANSIPVLIVGIQTGSSQGAGDEYIELANTTDSPIDMSLARIEYFSATPKDMSKPARVIPLQGTLLPGAHYVLTAGDARPGESTQTFSATLAAAGGHLRLASGSEEWDFVGWGTASAPHGQAVPVSNIIARKQNLAGQYSNTGDNAQDFLPDNGEIQPSVSPSGIVISELLPDPASPLVDTKDEFIELHSTSQEAVNLLGYRLYAGPSLGKNFTLSDIVLEPGAYVALYSAQTKLSLSNAGSRVQLVSPSGSVLSDVSYAQAQAGISWALDADTWRWTTVATPGAANELSEPPTATAKQISGSAKNKATTKKSTAKSASKGSVKGAATTTSKGFGASQDTPKPPLHNGVIAGVGGLAVLYGAYEYRNDVITFYQKLRRNRSSGRDDRQES